MSMTCKNNKELWRRIWNIDLDPNSTKKVLDATDIYVVYKVFQKTIENESGKGFKHLYYYRLNN